MWTLKNILLKSLYVNKEIKEEIKKYLKPNENTVFQNLWDSTKAVLIRKFIATQAYFKK